MGAALALSVLIVALTASLDSSFTERDLLSLFASDMTGVFILLLGAIGMTGEWRHRTIAGAVPAAPDRVGLLTAKLLPTPRRARGIECRVGTRETYTVDTRCDLARLFP